MIDIFDEWLMAGKNQYTAKEFIDAIENSGGIITTIASRVGCAWNTAQKYIEDMPTVKQAYENECEKVTDLAESTLLKAMRDGDTGSAKWWLERKRKDVYAPTQRNEITGKDGADLLIRIDR